MGWNQKKQAVEAQEYLKQAYAWFIFQKLLTWHSLGHNLATRAYFGVMASQAVVSGLPHDQQDLRCYESSDDTFVMLRCLDGKMQAQVANNSCAL